jgi:hypothetical protein
MTLVQVQWAFSSSSLFNNMTLGNLTTEINGGIDFAHTVEAGTRVLVVGTVAGVPGGTGLISLKDNGVDMTLAKEYNEFENTFIYYVVNPSVGAHQITQNGSLAACNTFAANLLASATTIDPPFDDAISATDESEDVPTVSGSIVFDIGYADMNFLFEPPVVGDGQTQIFNNDHVGNSNYQIASYRHSTGATTTMAWSGDWDGIIRVVVEFIEGPAPSRAKHQMIII